MTALVLERLALGPRLPRLDLTLEAGLRVLAAAPGPLFSLLLPCLAGLTRPRRGRVLWGYEDPYGVPELRARIGSLFVDEHELPWSTNVRSYVKRVNEFRQRAAASLHNASPASIVASPASIVASPASIVLDELLLETPCARLSAFERRRIALHLALTTPDARYLLLHEPLSALENDEEPALLGALSAHAAAGALVVVTTHEPRSARRLSADVHHLGALTSNPRSERTLLLSLDRPRDVAAALARSSLVQGTQLDPNRPRELRVTGVDDDALLAVVTRAVVESQSQLTEMTELGSLR